MIHHLLRLSTACTHKYMEDDLVWKSNSQWGGSIDECELSQSLIQFYLFPLRHSGRTALLSLSVGWLVESTVLIRQGRLVCADHRESRMEATKGINTKGKTKLTKNPQGDGQGGQQTDI